MKDFVNYERNIVNILKKPLTSKLFFPTTAISVILMLLASVGITNSFGAPKVTTIKVLGWAPGSASFWSKTISAFEKANPKIKVKLETVPNDGYLQVQGPYITSKSGPDVMANNAGLELFERKSAYLPLSARTKKVAAGLVTYSGACLNFDVTKTCFGLPFSYQGNVMYYNKSILLKAGLDPDKPPATMVQFDAACKAIKAIGSTCLALGLTGQFPSYWNFPEIARNYLTEEDMRLVLNGKLPWTDPKMVKVLQGLANLTNSGNANSDAASLAMLPDAANLFSSGKAAFAGTIISDAVNWLAFGKAIGDENLGAMRWPTIVSNAPLADKFSGIEGSVYGVTSWSKNKKQAVKFIEWIAGPIHGGLWVKEVGGQPLNKKVDTKALPNSPALRQIQKIISKPTLHVGVLLSAQEADALARGWQQVATGQLTVPQWTEAMQNALKNSPSKN